MKKKVSKQKQKIISKNLQYVIFAINVLILLLAFFNTVLLTSGGFDDVNWIEVLCLPIVSLIALGLAMINVAKYQSKGGELVCSIVCLAISSLVAFGYFIHPMIIEAIA